MMRKFKTDDTRALLHVWKQANLQAHPFLPPQFVRQVEQQMEGLYIPNSDTWLYEEDRSVIGFISMIDHEIGALFVLPEEQSRGIGSLLVDFVGMIYEYLEVEVFEQNFIGRGFYKKYGFRFLNGYWHEESRQRVYRLGCNVGQRVFLTINNTEDSYDFNHHRN